MVHYTSLAYVLQKAEPRLRVMELPTVVESWSGPLGPGSLTSAGLVDSSLRDAFVAAVPVGTLYGGGLALPGPSVDPVGYLIDVSSRESGTYAAVDRVVAYAPTFIGRDRSTYLLDGGYPKKTATFSAAITNSSVIPGQTDLACTCKVSFYSPESKYTYFTQGYPAGQAFAGVAGGAQPQIVGSLMTVSAGGQTQTFGGATAPSPVVSALYMPVADILDEFSPVQIPGTPWYKVTETWARVFQGDKA